MLWHSRCRWPARLSLPQLRGTVPKRKLHACSPKSKAGPANAGCFLVECLKRGDGPKALGLDITPTMLAPADESHPVTRDFAVGSKADPASGKNDVGSCLDNGHSVRRLGVTE